MAKSSLIRFTTCFAALFGLAHCGSPSGGTGTGGATSTGGATATGGTTSTGGATGSGGTTSTGGATATGGTTSTGGRGGTTSTGGAIATGGTASTGGRGGTTSTGGRGGTTSTGGATATGGVTSTGGSAARVDCTGVPLAKPGDMTSTSRAYLNLGDIRLINNRWGSDELGCSGTTQRVFVNTDRTVGWEFNRPICGGAKAKPDYPELEFGVAPFGAGNVLLTSPACSSTTALPRQIKDITSGTAKVDGMTITLSKPTVWNMSFELWLSQRNPATDPNPGVFAEIIVFWGWETGRWACDQTGTVTAGNNTYQLCHQSDTWANGQWRFYQFNVQGGPLTSYSGTVDAKALIEWVVTRYNLSRDLWVTRFEVGSEIDDNTAGSVRVRNVTFEVNGTSKSIELAP